MQGVVAHLQRSRYVAVNGDLDPRKRPRRIL
jgi:hypothetical protein